MANLSKQQVKDIIAKAPAGTSPAGIVASLRAKGHTLEGFDAAPAAPAGRQRDWTDTALDLLPGAGGLVGGLAGGAGGTVFGMGVGGVPGAIGGAAVGGAGGEAAKQLLERALGREAPSSSLEAAGKIGSSGAIQGAQEAVGLGAAKAASKVAGPLVELASNATPEVAKTAVREGITATSRGFRRLMNRIGQAAGNTEYAAAEATHQGLRFDGVHLARDVMAELQPELDQAKGLAGAATQRQLRVMLKRFQLQNGGLLTPSRLHAMKQAADELAAPIYKKIAQMEPVTAREALEAKFNKAVADHARARLEAEITKDAGFTGNYADLNARTQGLIKVKDAIWPTVQKEGSRISRFLKGAARPAGGAAIGATVGAATSPEHVKGALLGAAAGGILGSPGRLTEMAQVLNSPALAAALRFTPRTTAAIYTAGKE